MLRACWRFRRKVTYHNVIERLIRGSTTTTLTAQHRVRGLHNIARTHDANIVVGRFLFARARSMVFVACFVWFGLYTYPKYISEQPQREPKSIQSSNSHANGGA